MNCKLYHIILGELYQLNHTKYENYIKQKIIKKNWFKNGVKTKKIKVFFLVKTFNPLGSNFYARICDGELSFSKYHMVIFEVDGIVANRIKLHNINTINKTIYNIFSLLYDVQNNFARTNSFYDLIFCSRLKFIEMYKDYFDVNLHESILSKVLNSRYIAIGVHKFDFVNLLPTLSFINSLRIKKIIISEPSLNDDKIAAILNREYNCHLTRRNICSIRNKYFIPSKNMRKNMDLYHYYQKLFSPQYVLSVDNLSKIHCMKGIYELLGEKPINYALIQLGVLYIGSSKNIKARLSKYINGYGHTKTLQNYIASNNIYFRYFQTPNYKELEKIFLNEFKNISGSLPLLNKQNIL